MGAVLKLTKKYDGALDYFQQALRAKEKALGKTHPDTLRTHEHDEHVRKRNAGLH